MISLLLALSLPSAAQEPADEELPLIEGPSVLGYVDAPWPEAAQGRPVEATINLLIELDDAGALVGVEVLSSEVVAAEADAPAPEDSDALAPLFAEAALTAVRAMKFAPARTEVGPVGVAFEFAYGFTYDPPPPPEPEPDAPPEPPPPLPVNFDGTITEMGTRVPVVGARVVVVGSGATLGAEGADLVGITDSTGRFEIRGVPLGPHTIRVISPDHVEIERPIEIFDGEITGATLWIRSLSYRENEAVGLYSRPKEEVTRRTLSIEEIRRVPGTFGDPIKVVQTLPGAARSPFGTGLLIIRGANPEDSGVYVDGVRVPLIYHLTGTTSVLTPDLIESVDYLPGGFAGQYGRSMAGVIDVKTKTEFAENGKIVWGTDILDSQVYYEGMLGKDKKHGFAAGVRRSYIDLFIPLFVRDAAFTLKPRYWDYSTKYVRKFGADHRLSVFVYGFEDILRVGTPDDVAQGSDADFQGDFKLKYSTHRVLVNYTRPLSDTLALSMTPSFGLDYAETDLAGALSLDNYNGVTGFRAELPWTPSKKAEIVPGVDLLGGPWTFAATFPFSVEEAQDPLAERNPVTLDGRGQYWSPDVYVKAKLRPFEDPDKLLLTPSLRLETVRNVYKGSVTYDQGRSAWGAFALDPRLALRAELFEGGTLKASSGLYHQPPQPFESVGVGADATVGFERAWNSSLGFEHQLNPAVSWDLDLFWRDMSRLIVENDNFTDPGDSPFFNAGLGRAYGAEVILRHAPANRFFGWISYTLSKSERKDAPEDEWVAFDFDQRHILSAQGGYDLPLDLGVSAQVQFVTGNPTSPYNTGIYDVDTNSYNPFRAGGSNSERLPAFFQTSLRVDKLWTFRTWQLETYVDFLNAVRGVNPEFTQYSYDYTEYAYVRGLPFIPNIGIEAKFTP